MGEGGRGRPFSLCPRMDGMETRRRFLPQTIVTLSVGALLGFAGGYFAGGGGRPAPLPPAGEVASGDSGDRLAQLAKAAERDPENPEILTEMGNLYYDREDWNRAIACYEKARRKAPGNPNLLSDLGAAHRNRGDFDRAAAYFRKARAGDPNHWQSLLNLVLLEAFDRRDPKAAQSTFDELKRRFPDIPQLDRIQAQISSLRAGSG
jgi:tetratricopeptide (TPR) repeat protein